MAKSDRLEQLLMARLDRLEAKLDDVRTEDIPNLKTELALQIERNKPNSKLHSSIAAVASIIIASLIDGFKR